MTSSRIEFDEQSRLDERHVQATLHDLLKSSLAQLDVGGGGSMGSGHVRTESGPPLTYTSSSTPSYPQRKPSIATPTRPVMELIRSTLYAALAEVVASTPSLIPLKSDPPPPPPPPPIYDQTQA